MAGIFKAYDVRGIYPKELDEETARRIGFAIARSLGARRLVAGRDMRLSAPSMHAAAIDGARRAGADVIDIGLASTPMAYFAIGSLGTDGGFQVTASHNPPEYVGFKVCRRDAVPVGGESGLAEVEAEVRSGRPLPPAATGRVETCDLLADFARHVLRFAGEVRPFRVMIDAGNGMGGHTLPPILEGLPVKTTRLFFEPDGRFPNHEADPLKDENLAPVSEAVRRERADLGVAFDGDADRCIFVDEHGERVGSDLVTALIARDLLRTWKGPIVYDLRSSRVVPETILAGGGTPVRERVGHAFIKATMRRIGSRFGGELSGHFYFGDNWTCDSGEIAFVRMLTLLSAEGRPFSEVLRPLRRTVTSGELNFRVADKDAKLAELVAAFPDAETDRLDGITVQYRDWWCNVRPSNTEPVLRLNLEASDRATFDRARERVLAILGKPL
jgi:phosphomannomutase